MSNLPVRDAWLLASVRERYGIGPRYILYFGGFDLRKNVPRIIQAYGKLPEPLRREYQLVIAGRYQHLGHPLLVDSADREPRFVRCQFGGGADQVEAGRWPARFGRGRPAGAG